MRPLKLVPDNTNIPFLRYRFVALIVSLLLILGSGALVATRGLNLGVDFVGGQMIRVQFTQPVDVEQLRERVDSLGLGEATIQQFGSPRDVSIRLPLPPGGEEGANRAASRVRQVSGATPAP